MTCRDCDSPYHRSCPRSDKAVYTGRERRTPGPSIVPDDVIRDRRTRDGIREILRQTLTPIGICESVPSTTDREEIAS